VGVRGRADGVDVAKDGTWTLKHQPVGATRLRVTAEGFATVEVGVEVRAGMPLVEARLSRGALVRVQARTKDGTPVAALLIAKRVASDDEPDWRWTDSEGAATWHLLPGRYRISAQTWKDDEPTDTPLGEWVLTDGETRSLDLVVPPN
jgi:hypothetical protein